MNLIVGFEIEFKMTLHHHKESEDGEPIEELPLDFGNGVSASFEVTFSLLLGANCQVLRNIKQITKSFVNNYFRLELMYLELM